MILDASVAIQLISIIQDKFCFLEHRQLLNSFSKSQESWIPRNTGNIPRNRFPRRVVADAAGANIIDDALEYLEEQVPW